MYGRRQRSNLGLMLLAFEMFSLGLENIPAVTMATMGLNIYLFLFPAAPLMKSCLSVEQVYQMEDWRRLLLAPFHHADDLHLYFNMVSFLWKGRRLERRLGGVRFLYMVSVFTVLTGLVYILLEMLLTELTEDQSYSMQCAVGFSGVLFALKVVNNYYYPGSVTYIMGIPVSSRLSSWVELVLIHITAPGTSFVGHLSGILVGLLYTSGPLKKIMYIFSDFLTVNGGNAGVRYNYSGPSGTRYPQRYDQSAAEVFSRSGLYTAGLSEEEQLDAAIRNSLSDVAFNRPEERRRFFH